MEGLTNKQHRFCSYLLTLNYCFWLSKIQLRFHVYGK